MENKTLGKLNKKFMYLNHGKYGPFITYDKVNYKIPEWFPHEKMDIDIAERLIEYKKKISEQWLEKTATPVSEAKVSDDESENESEDEQEKMNKRLTTKKTTQQAKPNVDDDESDDEEREKIKKKSSKNKK